MKQKLLTIFENYGLDEHVRISQKYGMGYVIKIKDGDGVIKPYAGVPAAVRKALGYNGFTMQADNPVYSDTKEEYSYTVREMVKENA
jgi:hypothetical protein